MMQRESKKSRNSCQQKTRRTQEYVEVKIPMRMILEPCIGNLISKKKDDHDFEAVHRKFNK